MRLRRLRRRHRRRAARFEGGELRSARLRRIDGRHLLARHPLATESAFRAGVRMQPECAASRCERAGHNGPTRTDGPRRYAAAMLLRRSPVLAGERRERMVAAIALARVVAAARLVRRPSSLRDLRRPGSSVAAAHFRLTARRKRSTSRSTAATWNPRTRPARRSRPHDALTRKQQPNAASITRINRDDARRYWRSVAQRIILRESRSAPTRNACKPNRDGRRYISICTMGA